MNSKFEVSSDKRRLDLAWTTAALKSTYWAAERSEDTIQRSIEGSLCYGVYESQDRFQVGFARVVSDEVTFAWLCDVVIDASVRGRGLGKLLISTILSDPRLSSVTFLLRTKDAHEFYTRYGFVRDEAMRRPRNHKPA